MRILHEPNSNEKLKLASSYYPPKTNSINDVSETLLAELKKRFKPLDEIKAELKK